MRFFDCIDPLSKLYAKEPCAVRRGRCFGFREPQTGANVPLKGVRGRSAEN